MRALHGKSHWPEHTIWMGMIARCKNPNATGFKHYGGRGISVCARWQDFENFISDMGRRPSERHSIDRVNPDGNYEPENCRWATGAEQAVNKRKTGAKGLTVNGVTKTLKEWAEIAEITPSGLWNRLRAGWPPEVAVATKSSWPAAKKIEKAVKDAPVKTERRNITQPADWWVAFEGAAERDGLSLAEWIGNACREKLPLNVRFALSDRIPRGKPRSDQSTE